MTPGAIDLSPSTLRRHVLHMASRGNSVHIACAFSMIEIVSVLYRSILNRGASATDPDRDYLILSKGHGVMAMYAAFRQLGWLEQKHLDNYFSDGSLLHGLCEANVPGFEVCSGSLGHGLPIAVGMAYGFKRDGKKQQVVCIVGDGEMHEGPMWESLMFAAHHKLDNLTVIVDANDWQAMGRVESVVRLEPFVQKFAAFGLDAMECNGHDEAALTAALSRKSGLPRALVARTVKGKGVSFMEDNNEWHYRRLNPELLAAAMKELAGA